VQAAYALTVLVQVLGLFIKADIATGRAGGTGSEEFL